MDEQLKENLRSLRNAFLKHKLGDLDKNSLSKLIHLYNYVSDDDIYTSIQKKISVKKLTDIEKELILIKIKSILTDFQKKYLKKVICSDYALYHYPRYIDIYVKNSNSFDRITREIRSLQPEEILLIQLDKKHEQSIKFVELSNDVIENFIRSNTPESIKIKLIINWSDAPCSDI